MIRHSGDARYANPPCADPVWRLRRALLVGTALGCSIVILATAAPNQAWAGDECGDDVGGVVVCTATSGVGNPYPTGIDYVNDIGEDITIVLVGGAADTAVEIAAPGYDGLYVSASGDNDASVFTYSGVTLDAVLGVVVVSNGAAFVLNEATINSVGEAILVDAVEDATVVSPGQITSSSHGVRVNSAEGDASIIVNNVDAGDLAAWATSYIGDASVLATGQVSAGITALSAMSNAGDASVVSTGSVTVSGSHAGGLFASSAAGDASTENTGEITTSGYRGEALLALSVSGDASSVNSGNVDTFGEFATGVAAFSLGPGSATAENSGNLTTQGTGSFGLIADSSFGNASATNSGSILTTGDHATAIITVAYVDSTVEDGLGTVVTMGLGAHGIAAFGGTGSAYVSTGSVTTYGLAAYAVIANSGGINEDDAAIVVGEHQLTTHGDFAVAIYAHAFGGDVLVTNSDNIQTQGNSSVGIVANAEGNGVAGQGNIEINFNQIITSGDAVMRCCQTDDAVAYYTASHGIRAVSLSGSVMVVGDGVLTEGDGAAGIIATAAGPLLIDVRTVQTQGEALLAQDGPDGREFDLDLAAVGIDAFSSGGQITLRAGSVSTVGVGAIGIRTESISDDPEDRISIESGSVTTRGDLAKGISARSLNGDISIVSGSVFTQGSYAYGIDARSDWGDVAVYSGSVIATGDHVFGIYAAALGGEALIYADNVRVTGVGSWAVYAYAGNNGGGLENASVVVSGDIYSVWGTGIVVGSNQISNILIGPDATVFGGEFGVRSGSTEGTLVVNRGIVSAGSGFAVTVNGGAATIRNQEGGTIGGFVDLTDYADVFDNEGLWDAFGTSRFSYGADTVANDGAFGFSRFQEDASTTTLIGLEVFNNTGVVSGVDGQAGDILALPDAVFTGGGGSTLALDVQLGAPGSTADRLTIGLAAGVTTIEPNDLLAGSPGVLNLDGILVVDSANASEVGDEFAMTAVDKGFVEYSLTFDPMTDNWLIVGLPSDAAFQMVTIGRSAQAFPAHAGRAVTARWQESRDAAGAGSALSAGPADGLASRSDGWELWMQGHGGDEGLADRQTFTVGGLTFDENLSRNTDWRGLQFGIDNRVGDSLWGVTMGFAQQETRFDTGDLSLDIEGWNVGGYFGWVAKNVFANVMVKGDFFEVDANLASVAAAVSFDGSTWGAQGEAGMRLGDQAASWFVEPVAALAWSSTQMDRASGLGATIDFGNAEGLVGKVGVRFGQTFETDDFVLTPVVGIFAVEEFLGDNQMTFATGPDSFVISDTPPGTYGQMEFGLTTETQFGPQGFLKGEWNFGGEADGGGVRMGLSWRW